MKHESVLSNSFKEVTQSNLSKLDYETSNYIPVYSIGFPECDNNLNYYSRKLSINYDLQTSVFNNSYLNNILSQFYYNKNHGKTIDFNEQEFKDVLRTNILEVKLLLHSEIDSWIDNPLMINQNISPIWGTVTRQTIKTTFFKYNYFGIRKWRNNMVYNYGFIGKYINNILTPKIVLMTKKEHINTIKKCFILNQNFPKDIFELWVSPELDSYILNLYKGLSGLISENGWKVFKYDMQAILAGIELPSFRSVKHKNEFEDNSWIEFCNKELALV